MDDWQTKIRFLEARGLTRAEIAAAVGMAYSSLCDLANGSTKEPRGMSAVRLHDLYRVHEKSPPCAAPSEAA